MKLRKRNKKTGQILTFIKKDNYYAGYIGNYLKGFYPQSEINEEWEDYEEPKKYWLIDAFGNIVQNEITKHYGDEYTDMTDAYENQKQIGNYFETKEQAEKAVEKLKAWKRLKEGGFKFESWDGYVETGDEFDSGDHFECCGFVNARGQFLKSFDKYTQFKADLDLLFSGEEF